MADPDAERVARWRANRRRMVRDLQQQIDTLLDRAEGGSLESLSPDDGALAFSRVLRLLTDATDGDVAALDRLAVVGSSTDSSASHESRDAEVAVEELARLQERIADLEGNVTELTDVAETRDRKIGELRQELDAYRSLGAVGEIEASLDRWRAIAEVLFRLLADSELICAQYEVVLGPVLLQLDRRCSGLSSILQSLADAAPSTLQPSRALLAGLADLGADPDSAVANLDDAVDILQQRRQSTSATPFGVDRSSLAVLDSAEFQTLLRSASRGDGADRRSRVLAGVLGESELASLYSTLRSAGRVSSSRIFGSSPAAQLSRGTTSAPAAAASAETTLAASALHDSESDDFDEGPRVPSSTKRRRLRQGGRFSKHQRTEVDPEVEVDAQDRQAADPQEVIVLSESERSEESEEAEGDSSADDSDDALFTVTLALSSRKKHNIEMPTTQGKLVKIRDAELRRFKANDEARGSGSPWPLSAPRRRDTPNSVAQLACFAWQLGLFRDEVLVPKSSEYSKFVDTATHRYPTMAEVDRLYATEPWKIISRRLEPTLFDEEHPHFAAMYKNARALYKRHAQALWERSHCFIPADDASGSAATTRVKSRRTVFLDRRRKRNSDLTPCWLGHLELVLSTLVRSDSDADVLLDPFFIWPPAFGVELAIPLVGESLSACVRRLDRVEPQRVYFRPCASRRQLPLSRCYQRIFDNSDNLTYTSFDDLMASWTRTSDSPGIPNEARVVGRVSPPASKPALGIGEGPASTSADPVSTSNLPKRGMSVAGRTPISTPKTSKGGALVADARQSSPSVDPAPLRDSSGDRAVDSDVSVPSDVVVAPAVVGATPPPGPSELSTSVGSPVAVVDRQGGQADAERPVGSPPPPHSVVVHPSTSTIALGASSDVVAASVGSANDSARATQSPSSRPADSDDATDAGPSPDTSTADAPSAAGKSPGVAVAPSAPPTTNVQPPVGTVSEAHAAQVVATPAEI